MFDSDSAGFLSIKQREQLAGYGLYLRSGGGKEGG